MLAELSWLWRGWRKEVAKAREDDATLSADPSAGESATNNTLLASVFQFLLPPKRSEAILGVTSDHQATIEAARLADFLYFCTHSWRSSVRRSRSQAALARVRFRVSRGACLLARPGNAEQQPHRDTNRDADWCPEAGTYSTHG